MLDGQQPINQQVCLRIQLQIMIFLAMQYYSVKKKI